MATEGQTAVGPNGERAVFRNGQWEVVSAGGQASPQVSVTPLPRNPADVEREARENARNAAGDQRDETRLGLTVEDKNRQRGNDNFNQTTNLAGSFNAEPAVKAYRVAIAQLGQALRTGAGPQADLALTYAFAKAMDPESVVRESEQGMVTDSQPWLQAKAEQIRKQFGADGAGNFTPEARQQLRLQISSAVAQRAKVYDARRRFYTQQAQSFGIDPALVVGQHDAAPFVPLLQDWVERSNGPEPVAGLQQGIAKGGDSEKSIPIPQDMQQAHAQYLAQNWGRLTPEGYAQFRAGLDQQYGFEPRPDVYSAAAEALNERAQQGGSWEGLNIPPVNAPMDAQDRLNNSVFNNGFGAAMLGVADMTGGIDEAAAGVRSMMNGTDYSVELDRANALKGALRDVSPAAYIGGNIAGSIVAGGAAAKLAPGLATAAQTAPGMLGIGAAYGGVTGALEGNDNRLAGAAMGAGAGVAGGAVGRYAVAPAAEALMRSGAGRATSNVIRGAINRAKPGAVEATSNAPVMDAATSRIVGAAPDVGAVRTNLEDAARLGLPFSLADASPELRALGGAVTRRSVGARGMVENIVEPRARGQAERAFDAIDTRLAPVVDIPKQQASLLEAGRIEAAPFYNAAYRQGTAPRNLADMTRPGKDVQLEDLLSTPTGQEAMRRAQRIAADSQVGTGMTGLQADGQGARFVEAPNLRTLDLVKRGIDDIIEGYRDPTTRRLNLDEAGRAIEGFRQRFVSAVDERFPVYSEARGAYAPFAQRAEALDTGYGVGDLNVRPNDLPGILAGAGDTNVPELRSGFATRLGDQVNDTRLSGNPWERVYGTPNQQAKIGAMFPEGAQDFGRIYDLEREMAKTTRETIGGSPTAGRLQADSQLGDAMGAGLEIGADVLTGGGASGLGTIFGAVRRVAGDGLRLGVGKAAERRAEQVAPVLFNTNPQQALSQLDSVAGALDAIRRRKADFARRSGMFGALVAPGALVPFTE